ncbi:conserved hypothetical protein [Uncinocarpus reesii 1704]|uniref:Diacylglycerol O-acyltransferase n=1 Tax=Uncinocarpus reesii (strain UAMH 1704) TaxID=336963 RepID=C4K060_UNCRE|nr:uncharacterized protein UREG_07811 [Uncinocarpus reesii 1704]EEP82946.1 conserved hypothetical protein [Uncinocarpus reesii 1704]
MNGLREEEHQPTTNGYPVSPLTKQSQANGCERDGIVDGTPRCGGSISTEETWQDGGTPPIGLRTGPGPLNYLDGPSAPECKRTLNQSRPRLQGTESPLGKYIFGYHPHGIISHGAFAAFATEALGFSELFPGITNSLLTLDSNFRLPFYRDYALAMGLASVSRESCENLLSKGGADGEGMGRAITIVVGGARESLDAQPHMIRLFLKRRKGFIKLAIRTGADLVPVLAFGENELYKQVASDQHPLIHKFQLLVKRTMGFTIPLFHARGVFNYDVGLMPYRRPLNIVVGKPIPVLQQPHRDKIEDKYVDDLHARYVASLQTLWEEWKDTFATERQSELEIN